MRSEIHGSDRTTLYIDPFSGVSGDMLLGAFIDAGVPLDVIRGAVDSVIPGEVDLNAVPVTRAGLAGTFCEVRVVGGPEKRTLDEMLGLVENSGLPEPVIRAALQVLGTIGDAERKAHGVHGGPVHLHELGGQDTLADIVGTVSAVEHVKPLEVRCGPVNLGRGFVKTDHGLMPVPAPATARIIEGMAVFSDGPEGELTTPTGAAILSGIVDVFGAMEPMEVIGSGCGAGSRDPARFPNLLRIFIGRPETGKGVDGAVMMECGIDDASPEYLAPVVEALHAEGALEVHILPAAAKKGRLGVLVRVLASEDKKDALAGAVMDAAGSPGLRSWRVDRTVLPREVVAVSTRYGEVSFKRWTTPSGQTFFKPEFDDIQRLAGKAGVSAARMRDLAVAAYMREVGYGQDED